MITNYEWHLPSSCAVEWVVATNGVNDFFFFFWTSERTDWTNHFAELTDVNELGKVNHKVPSLAVWPGEGRGCAATEGGDFPTTQQSGPARNPRRQYSREVPGRARCQSWSLPTKVVVGPLCGLQQDGPHRSEIFGDTCHNCPMRETVFFSWPYCVEEEG